MDGSGTHIGGALEWGTESSGTTQFLIAPLPSQLVFVVASALNILC